MATFLFCGTCLLSERYSCVSGTTGRHLFSFDDALVVIQLSPSMDKNNLASREAKTIPPTGGIFLCPQELVPTFVADIVGNLGLIKANSTEARQRLMSEMDFWHSEKLQGNRMTYGKELEQFVYDESKEPGQKKLQPPSIREEVIVMEALHEQASRYHDACATIRKTAHGIGAEIGTQMNADDGLELGENTYTMAVGPFGYTFFCKVSDYEDQLTIFDWAGEVDPQYFRHAELYDQISLIRDVLSSVATPNVS